MDELCGTLAVSRATLYRIVGSRDELLTETLWFLAERAISRARRARTRCGADGILQVTRLLVADLLAAPAIRIFVRHEPETAARLLLAADSGVHGRVVATQVAIFREAAVGHESWLSRDLDYLAHLYVRIVEAMLYSDLSGAARPDREITERAMRALLAG